MRKTSLSLKKKPDHSHAWRGSWNRPMKMDERDLHPFTIARMTDHNVRGRDRKTRGLTKNQKRLIEKQVATWESEGGHVTGKSV